MPPMYYKDIIVLSDTDYLSLCLFLSFAMFRKLFLGGLRWDTKEGA